MAMKWGLAGLSIVFFVIIIFLTSIEITAFDLNFYKHEYAKLNVYQETGMSNDELMRVTEELLDYIRDERKDLKIVGMVEGETRQVFNDREIAHMVDVKDLFLKGIKLRTISIVGLLLSLLLLYRLVGKRLYRYLAGSYVLTFGIIFTLGIVLSILMYQDFTPIWDQFHYIFFSNDLWQLNPETDIMIRMVPEQFFFDTVRRILSLFGGTMIILFIPSLMVMRRRR